jgi:hypothetical protein
MQAEVGFIVVQVDGMGTSFRSKAFHDVAWKNLKDAGFPDRILWHRAVAAKYPWYDIGRVGIYGTSAGGQNSLGALLFHPDFYHVAVSYVGCHDNRMDKIWWNEQWMGWPLGPHYAESSNVDNAWRLRGRVLLVGRRARHQRRPLVDAAGGQRADQGEQDLRLALDSQRRPRGGSDERRARVRHARTVRLLREAPARPGAARVERRRDVRDRRRRVAVRPAASVAYRGISGIDLTGFGDRLTV